MNVLIAGGFWSIAKFMVLLCCTVILIIKSLYFYIKTCKKWKKMTQIFYIMMVGSFLLSLIIGLCGVVGLIRNYWDAGSLSMLIFSQVSGGIFVKMPVTPPITITIPISNPPIVMTYNILVKTVHF